MPERQGKVRSYLYRGPFRSNVCPTFQFNQPSQVAQLSIISDVPCSTDAVAVGEEIDAVRQECDEDVMSVEEPIDWKAEVRGVIPL